MSMRDDIPWHWTLMNVVKWQTWYKVRSKLFDSVRHALRGRWKTLIIFDKLKSSLQWTCSLPQRGLFPRRIHTCSTTICLQKPWFSNRNFSLFSCLEMKLFQFCFQVFPSLCALDCHVRYLHRDRFLASVTRWGFGGRWAGPESRPRPVEVLVVKVCKDTGFFTKKQGTLLVK